MVTDAEIQACVSKLTGIHKFVICEIMEDYMGHGPSYIVSTTSHMGAKYRLTLKQSREIVKELRAAGILDYGTLFLEDEPKLCGRGYWLSHLGCKVRDLLRQIDFGEIL